MIPEALPTPGRPSGHPARQQSPKPLGRLSYAGMTDMETGRETGLDPLALAEALAGGSTQALSECYQRWGSLVMGIASRALGSRHDAEDVVQQVFVSAWQSRHTLRPSQTALPAWLIGITRHRIADEYARRSRGAAKSRQAAGAAGALAPGAEVAGHALVDRLVDGVVIRDALERMPEPRRTVLQLAYLHDEAQEDIARRLDLPLGTVKSHLRRGLLQLRRDLTASREIGLEGEA